VPAEPTILPVALVPEETPIDDLVAVGLMNRPELAESRALVEAALYRWRQARLGPVIPRLDLAYLGGTFGGGIDETVATFGARGDGMVQLTWTARNLFAGNVADTAARRSQYNQANLHVLEIESQVAAEVTAAVKDSRGRRRSLADAARAVTEAYETWRIFKQQTYEMTNPRNRKNTVDTLEPLIAEQALEQARLQYLDAVIGYNRAQFRLYTALGQPSLEALPKATCLPLSLPVLPPANGKP
jgi:outer membrane protein TolC